MPSPFILPRSNFLAYPAGVAPGFDPTHVAANNCRFSGITVPGNYFSLFSGKAGQLPAQPLANIGIDGYIGCFAQCSQLGGGQGVVFSGFPATDDKLVTFGAICIQTDTSAQRAIIRNANAGTTGSFLSMPNSVGGFLCIRASTPNITLTSNITPIANVPYFVGASANWNTGAANFVLLRLDTGSILTSSITGSSGDPTAGDGQYSVGDYSSGGTSSPSHAKIAAAMYANQFMSSAQLLQWAANPWSFWYPRRAVNYVGVTAAGGFIPAWAIPSNLPVLGTGVY
jgi:hypothetical protein